MKQIQYERLVKKKLLDVFPFLVEYQGHMLFIHKNIQFCISTDSYVHNLGECLTRLTREEIDEIATGNALKAVNEISYKLIEIKKE